jgi:hypothetical protein
VSKKHYRIVCHVFFQISTTSQNVYFKITYFIYKILFKNLGAQKWVRFFFDTVCISVLDPQAFEPPGSGCIFLCANPNPDLSISGTHPH